MFRFPVYRPMWGRGKSRLSQILMLAQNKPYHQNGIKISLGRPMFSFSVAQILTEL
jgi:hypothetical protein